MKKHSTEFTFLIPANRHVCRGAVSAVLLVLAILNFTVSEVEGLVVQTSGAAVKSDGSSGNPTTTKDPAVVVITGLVRRQLDLGLRDLKGFGSVFVRRVDYRTDGFFGDFECRGVPLATILSLAGPRKELSDFMRPTDLAVIVRAESGRSVLLSYGEIFFRPQGDVVLAFDAEPVLPRRSCDTCHEDRSDHSWMQVLKRKPALPRLVVARDLIADRCLEGVTSIEVVEIYSLPKTPGKTKVASERPQSIQIRDGSKVLATVRSLESYQRHKMHALEVGDAMGYHGEAKCEGALLTDVLAAAGVPSGPDIGYVIAAPDGFRATLSSAELFSTVQPQPVYIADQCNGLPLGEQGAFKLLVANDTIAERWVKSVSTINVIRIPAHKAK